MRNASLLMHIEQQGRRGGHLLQTCPAANWRILAERQGLTFFCIDSLEHLNIKSLFGNHLFQAAILIFKLAEPTRIVDFHAAKFSFPGVERALGHAVLLTQFFNLDASFAFFEDGDNLLFGKTFPLHGPISNLPLAGHFTIGDGSI